MELSLERSGLLGAITEAYARGDNADGEHMLIVALDLDIPWNEVTAAAARGIELQSIRHRR